MTASEQLEAFEQRKANYPVVQFFGKDQHLDYLEILEAVLGPEVSIYDYSTFSEAIECAESEIPGILASDFEQRNIQHVERGESPVPAWPLVLVKVQGKFTTVSLYEPKVGSCYYPQKPRISPNIQ